MAARRSRAVGAGRDLAADSLAGQRHAAWTAGRVWQDGRAAGEPVGLETISAVGYADGNAGAIGQLDLELPTRLWCGRWWRWLVRRLVRAPCYQR